MFRPEPETAIPFPQDDRVILIRDFQNMNTAGEYYFRSGVPVLCPYMPLKAEERTELKNLARAAIGSAENTLTGFLSCAQIERSASPVASQVIKIIGELSTLFERMTDRRPIDIELRINSVYPAELHPHESTLSYTFNGPGTVWLKGNFQECVAPTSHILLFDNFFLHKSSQYRSYEDPKISLQIT